MNKGKTQKSIRQIIAAILAIAFTVTSVPYEGYAVKANEAQEVQTADTDSREETDITEDTGYAEDTGDMEQNADVEAQPEDTGEGPSADSYEISEEEARFGENTETSTTFDVGDNKKMTVFYQEAVRYKDEDGKLVDYDPSLTEITDEKSENQENLDGYSFENTEGDKKHYFPEALTEETPVLLENEGYGIAMNPSEELQSIQVEDEEYTNGYEDTKEVPLKAVYESAEASVSYEYTSMPSGVKEEIVIKERPEENTFAYDLRLDGMIARKNQLDEGITLYDSSTEEIVGNLTPPNMNDASGEAYSEALVCEVAADETEEGLYHVTVTADNEYLQAPERVYPVTIDPTATWSGKTNVGDVYVLSGSKYKGINFYDSGTIVINAGKGSKGVYRTYMKFTDLTKKIKGYYVDSAVLTLYETGNSNSGQTVQAYKVKSGWSYGKLTWNNKPGFDTLYSSVKSTGKYKSARKLNLTAFARGVANGSVKDYGIMLKGASESGHYCEFVGSRHSASSLRPKLAVVYYNKPTTPTAVTITPQYLKRGSQIKAAWSGISSKSLAYVQYRLAKCDASWNELGTVVGYSGSTKLGTTGSGSATVAASSGWGDGIYKLAVRGVDSGGIAGVGKGCGFFIDGTAPSMNQPAITPASSAAAPADNLTPTVSWSGVSDANLKQIECSVNNSAFVSAGTAASGSYKIPAGKITGNGEHTIVLRAVDKAGNVKAYTLKYYLNKYGLGFEGYLPETGSYQVRKEYGKNILSWKTKSALSDSVYYRIYRGESENFKADDSSLVADKVKDGYWVDIHSVSDKKYYYKAEVVRANTAGKIEGRVSLNQTLSMDGTKPETFKKKTGNKGYLGYHEFSTPTGNGSIENSGGNLSYSQEDAELPANQLSFDVTRNYNSQLNLAGMYGNGWTDSLHRELLLDESGKVYFLDGDGSIYSFEKTGGAYQCAETKDYTLQSAETAVPLIARAVRAAVAVDADVKEDTSKILSSKFIGTSEYVIKEEKETTGSGSGSKPSSGNIGAMGTPGGTELDVNRISKTHAYTVKTKDGVLYRFGADGRLIAAVEPNGTFLLYEYGADGRLATVQTGTGKKISLTYQGEAGLLQSISLPDGTALTYTYEGGALTQAAHTSKDQKESQTFRYGYTDGRLSLVTDGKGQAYTISYQGERAEQITYPNKESYLLDYQTGKTSVTKKSEDGAKICTTSTEYDTETGKTLKETGADGDTTTYEYGFAGNPYLVTKTKRTIGYETITDGRVEFRTEEKVTETTYNADENVKSETAEDGTVTAYSYDSTSEWTADSPKTVDSKLDKTALSKETTEYDANGNALKETDATDADNQTVTVNVYDDDGNLLESTVTEDGMEVSKSTCTYDADGNILYEKEVSADVISEEKNTYDLMGRPLKTTDETTGQVTEYTYDYLGRTTKTAVTLNGKTQTSTSVYDANGTVIKETDTAGITTEYQYDPINRAVERKVTKGDTITYRTEYTYGDVTVQDGIEERTIKNASIEKESYPDGSVSSEKYYDKDGRVVREKQGGLYTDYTYDESGNQTVAYSNGTEAGRADGRITLTLYNEKGNQTATVLNPSVENGSYTVGKDTIVTKQQYDDKGNVIKETDAKGVVTEYAYDDSSRITQVTQDAAGEKLATKAEYTTDAAGGTTATTITDAAGHTSVEIKDAAGLTRSTTDHGDSAQESIATAYEYDSRGNQIKATYENDAYKTYTYDERNLLTKTAMYGSDGKQTLQTDYTYDDQYRQTKMIDSRMKDGHLTPYRFTYTGYDGFGRTAWSAEVSSESEPSEEMINAHKITYAYDAEDKVTGISYALVTDGGVAGLTYTYDKNRWLTGVHAVIKGRDEKPAIREYAYDTQGKVSEIREYPGFAGGAAKDAAADTGEEAGVTAGNAGVVENVCIIKTYSYDSLDRVTSMTYKKGSEILESYAYQYDKNNQITEKTEVNNTPKTEHDKVNVTKAYTYNALGQLTKTEVTDHKDGDKKQTTVYEYDKAGNRTRKVKGSAETSYTYNGLDQLLTAVTERGGAEERRVTYEYDVNGNQVKESDAKTSVTTVNEYDADNRLSKAVITMSGAEGAEQAKTVTQENLYNGNGQRVLKSEGAKETNYFYQDGAVSYTTEESGDTKAIQNLLGLEDNVILAESDSRNYYLYNKDIQGSTTSVLNADGTGEVSYEYDDFGETEINGNSVFRNEICYTGGIYDESTGLYYLNARYYDPENGRFLTEDTYRGEVKEPDTLHLYVYCKNNPINYVDPSGHVVVEATLLYYAGATVVASGLVLYYSNLARIRDKTYYIYKTNTTKKKKYRAKAVMPKAGAKVKSSINMVKAHRTIKNGSKKRTNDKHTSKRAGSQKNKAKQKKNFKYRGNKKRGPIDLTP